MSDKIIDLVGKTMTKVYEDGHTVVFTTTEGEEYVMYHESDCCESVHVDSVVGCLDNLVGYPITNINEDISHDNPPDCNLDDFKYQDSFTWTTYTISTAKGVVRIRWYGESNGYYSESVDFRKSK